MACFGLLRALCSRANLLRCAAGLSAEASGAAIRQGQGAAGRYTAADYQRAYASGAVTPLQVLAWLQSYAIV